MRRILRGVLGIGLVTLLVVAGFRVRTATAAPLVRQLAFAHPGLAAAQAPVRTVLLAILPIRIGAPADLWVVDVTPPHPVSPASRGSPR